MDTDVTRFLHVFGIRDRSIGIWNHGNLVLKPFFIPEILAMYTLVM